MMCVVCRSYWPSEQRRSQRPPVAGHHCEKGRRGVRAGESQVERVSVHVDGQRDHWAAHWPQR